MANISSSKSPLAITRLRSRGKGFARQSKRAELLVNQPATVNFALTVQSVDTVVEVSAEA